MSQLRRHSLRTYAKLTTGAVLLVGLNYVFTKLFDAVFGKFDTGYIIGVGIDVAIFIGFFTIFIWWVDTRGTLARMMGARDENALDNTPADSGDFNNWRTKPRRLRLFYWTLAIALGFTIGLTIGFIAGFRPLLDPLWASSSLQWG